MIRAPALKSAVCSDHQLDLFQVDPGSIPWPRSYIVNWFASCQLGFLSLFHWPCKLSGERSINNTSLHTHIHMACVLKDILYQGEKEPNRKLEGFFLINQNPLG